MPDDLREWINDTGLWPALVNGSSGPIPVPGLVRRAMRDERALRMGYADEAGRSTERDIWPVQLAYYEGKQIIVAWCCVREAFRHFRSDRIVAAEPTERHYGRPRRMLASVWRAVWERLHRDRAAERRR